MLRQEMTRSAGYFPAIRDCGFTVSDANQIHLKWMLEPCSPAALKGGNFSLVLKVTESRSPG